jgi:hypothetical protein
MKKLPLIEIGYQAFVEGGDEEFGAVRDVVPDGRPELIIYVENSGEFAVPLDAVTKVHDQKVVFDPAKLEPKVTEAIRKAHDAESL